MTGNRYECDKCKKLFRREQLVANDEGKMLCESCYNQEKENK